MYYMGFTYKEAYNIPLWQRQWFMNRLNEEIKKSNDQQSSASRAAHANTPEMRQMQGNHRSMVPSKLRRFT